MASSYAPSGRAGTIRSRSFVGNLLSSDPVRYERTVSIMDFAPTITAMLGVPLPDVDGRPIEEMLGGSAGGLLP